MNQIDYTIDPELDYLNEDLCDVVFEVEGQRIPASKLALSYRSRVFRAMFSGKHEGSEDKVIAIEDTTAEAFKTFIRSINCEQWVAPKTSEDNFDFELIGQLYRLSDRYELRRQSDKIMDFIKPFVVSHLSSMARIAFNYQMDPLMAIINEYIEMNINEIINKDIEELSEINDCTNNILFDALFSGRISSGHSFYIKGKHIYVKSSVISNKRLDWNSDELSRHPTIKESFEAFKVFIGFLYFNRLILKDINDYKLIHEVCEMAERYSFKDLKNAISDDLKNRITLNNVKPILNIISKIDIKDLRENVFEFIGINAEELLKRDVQLIREICIINKKYPRNDLLTAISSVIKNILTFDNLRPILSLIYVYDIKHVMEKVFEFIHTNIEELVTKDIEELISKKNKNLELIREIFYHINKYKFCVDLKEQMNALLSDCLTFDNLVIIHKIAVIYNIEDLITNIKTFIVENRRQLSDKDMEVLNKMNKAMNGTLFEVLVNHSINN